MKNQFRQNIKESISALEVYYFKVDTKRESMFCLEEDRLCFDRKEILEIFFVGILDILKLTDL